jgi:hypothetical protein
MANLMKVGDAKLKGLRQKCYDSQLPKEEFNTFLSQNVNGKPIVR